MANSAVGNRNTQYTHICIFLKYLKFNKLPQILHYWHSNCSGGSQTQISKTNLKLQLIKEKRFFSKSDSWTFKNGNAESPIVCISQLKQLPMKFISDLKTAKKEKYQKQRSE